MYTVHSERDHNLENSPIEGQCFSTACQIMNLGLPKLEGSGVFGGFGVLGCRVHYEPYSLGCSPLYDQSLIGIKIPPPGMAKFAVGIGKVPTARPTSPCPRQNLPCPQKTLPKYHSVAFYVGTKKLPVGMDKCATWAGKVCRGQEYSKWGRSRGP